MLSSIARTRQMLSSHSLNENPLKIFKTPVPLPSVPFEHKYPVNGLSFNRKAHNHADFLF